MPFLNLQNLQRQLLALIFLTSHAWAVESVPYHPSALLPGKQWDVLDISFKADEATIKTELSAKFQHESGEQLEVQGFFNGSGNCVLRFTPPKPGNWKFETKSSDPSINARQGQVAVAAAAAGRRGGIQIDLKNPRRFHFENGDDYYPIAFECDWLFALDAENPKDFPVTRKFVDTLAENGFNQIVMNVFAYDVKWGKDPTLKSEFDYGSPKVFPFGGTNENPDHSKLNIEYFQRLDRVIDYLDQKGIAAHLMIYVWNKRVNWPASNSEADNLYFDYVARRYQAFPNLVWDISKEALGYGHNDVNYITDRIERLRKLDSYERLITVHDYGYCRRFQQNVDFVSVQLWRSELYGVMRSVLEAIPGKPILNIEHGGYERSPYVVFNGNYTSPEVCLERSYQCMFAGTFPTHYWQGAAWNVIIPDIQSLPESSRPKLEYYRYMRDFADRFQVDRLKAGDKMGNAGFALHNGSDLFLYYVPKECDFLGLRLPKTLKGKTVPVTWLNPFTGEYSAGESLKIGQWPKVDVPKGEGFRILVIDARSE